MFGPPMVHSLPAALLLLAARLCSHCSWCKGSAEPWIGPLSEPVWAGGPQTPASMLLSSRRIWWGAQSRWRSVQAWKPKTASSEGGPRVDGLECVFSVLWFCAWPSLLEIPNGCPHLLRCLPASRAIIAIISRLNCFERPRRVAHFQGFVFKLTPEDFGGRGRLRPRP